MQEYTEQELENLARMFTNNASREVAIELIKNISFKDFVYFNYFLKSELNDYSFSFSNSLAYQMIKSELEVETKKLLND